MTKSKFTIRDLTFMAMYLALFFVFDWLANQIGLFKMPNGGTLSISVIPLMMASYHLGWQKGVIVSLASVLLQFMTGQMYLIQRVDGFSVFSIFLQFVLDYLAAFGVYGLACLFKNYGHFYTGVAVTNLIRLAVHTVAGTVYWATPWGASFAYNAWYMIPTMVVCLILMPLIMPRVKSLMK